MYMYLIVYVECIHSSQFQSFRKHIQILCDAQIRVNLIFRQVVITTTCSLWIRVVKVIIGWSSRHKGFSVNKEHLRIFNRWDRHCRIIQIGRRDGRIVSFSQITLRTDLDLSSRSYVDIQIGSKVITAIFHFRIIGVDILISHRHTCLIKVADWCIISDFFATTAYIYIHTAIMSPIIKDFFQPIHIRI